MKTALNLNFNTIQVYNFLISNFRWKNFLWNIGISILYVNPSGIAKTALNLNFNTIQVYNFLIKIIFVGKIFFGTLEFRFFM